MKLYSFHIVKDSLFDLNENRNWKASEWCLKNYLPEMQDVSYYHITKRLIALIVHANSVSLYKKTTVSSNRMIKTYKNITKQINLLNFKFKNEKDEETFWLYANYKIFVDFLRLYNVISSSEIADSIAHSSSFTSYLYKNDNNWISVVNDREHEFIKYLDSMGIEYELAYYNNGIRTFIIISEKEYNYLKLSNEPMLEEQEFFGIQTIIFLFELCHLDFNFEIPFQKFLNFSKHHSNLVSPFK